MQTFVVHVDDDRWSQVADGSSYVKISAEERGKITVAIGPAPPVIEDAGVAVTAGHPLEFDGLGPDDNVYLKSSRGVIEASIIRKEGTDFEADYNAISDKIADYRIDQIATLFQDSAGTTPVDGSLDPVGLVDDQSLGNNNASQAVDENRVRYVQDLSRKALLNYHVAQSWLETSIVFPAADFTLAARCTILSPDAVVMGASTAKKRVSIGADKDGRARAYAGGESNIKDPRVIVRRTITMVMTVSSDFVMLYLDGELIEAIDYSGQLPTHPLFLMSLNDDGAAMYANGVALFGAAIFSRPLLSREVVDIHNFWSQIAP